MDLLSVLISTRLTWDPGLKAGEKAAHFEVVEMSGGTDGKYRRELSKDVF